MNKSMEEFIETYKDKFRIPKSLYCLGEYDFSKCTIRDLENIILETNPSSPKSIIGTCYIIGLYARDTNDRDLIQMIQNIDKNRLWKKAKPNAPRKFISHNTFEETYHDIGMFEEYNTTYYQTLFRCIYEGVYSDNLDVIKNLKASDIHGNTVTLHEDNGRSYDMELSDELIDGLKELSNVNTWERNGRFGVCHINLIGESNDTCFKLENRGSQKKDAYRYSYYRYLRKISKEYIEFNLQPIHLFVSGIAYRIRVQLEEEGISLEDAFSYGNKDKTVSRIISNELKRCNYSIGANNFREMVKGHLDIFAE